MLKQILKTSIVFCISVFFLELVHLYNGYPLLLGDSSNYIRSAIKSTETSHWSNTYIYFTRLNILHLKSLQWIPLVQNMLIAGILMYLCKLTFTNNWRLKFLLVSVLLTLTTLPWTSTMVMSDISTPICLLIGMILISGRRKLAHELCLYVLFFLLVSWHQSHIAIIPLFLFVAVVFKTLLFRSKSDFYLQVKQVMILLLLMAAAFVMEKNLIETKVPKKKQTSTKKTVKAKKDVTTGYYFVGVRMWEVGELDNLLATFCPDYPDNYLCTPNDDHIIPIRQVKYTERNANNKEYLKYSAGNKEFILACLTKPRFYYACFKAATSRGFELLRKTWIRRYEPSLLEQYRPLIPKISKSDFRSFKKTPQMKGKFMNKFFKQYKLLNKIWWLGLFPLTLIFLIITKVKFPHERIISKAQWYLILSLIFAHICNTMVCGTFSNMQNLRYSARTMWMVNLAFILIFIFVIEVRKKIKYSPDEADRTDTVS